MQIHNHFVAGNAEPVSDRLDDAHICLMCNDARDIFIRQPQRGGALLRDHLRNRENRDVRECQSAFLWFRT